MLNVTPKPDVNSGKSSFLPLFDIHTHIGRVKIQTTKGESQRINQPQDIVNLYEKLMFEIVSRITKDQEKYLIEVPDVEELAKPMFPIAESILALNKKKSRGWLVDQIITFPFNDIFHTKTQPKFVKSNRYVRHQVHTFDYTLRFTPFCRVDPTDEASSEEVRKSIKLGMSGLKLHPLSQGWVDKIKTPETREVLISAGDLHIPVIFDVPNKGVALDITSITQESRENSQTPVNVILGHTGFDYSSPEIFECLSQEGMFSETSGMRGKDVEIFFENVMSVPGWNEKLLFGTDHNYFSVLQAADLITFLFSKRFNELLEEHDDSLNPLKTAGNILGGNALNIIPVSWNEQLPPNSTVEYLIGLKDFQQALKAFISKQGNYFKLDLALDKPNDLILQVITFGINENSQSFIIHQTEDLKAVIIQSMRPELQKASTNEIYSLPLQSTTDHSSKTKTLNLNELQSILNKETVTEEKTN